VPTREAYLTLQAVNCFSMRSEINQSFDDIYRSRLNFGDKNLNKKAKTTPRQASKLDIQGKLIRLER
jgi:hypothetical protein